MTACGCASVCVLRGGGGGIFLEYWYCILNLRIPSLREGVVITPSQETREKFDYRVYVASESSQVKGRNVGRNTTTGHSSSHLFFQDFDVNRLEIADAGGWERGKSYHPYIFPALAGRRSRNLLVRSVVRTLCSFIRPHVCPQTIKYVQQQKTGRTHHSWKPPAL